MPGVDAKDQPVEECWEIGILVLVGLEFVKMVEHGSCNGMASVGDGLPSFVFGQDRVKERRVLKGE